MVCDQLNHSEQNSSMRNKVLFLGCNYDEIPYLLELKKRGFIIIGTDLNPDAPGIIHLDKYYECSYLDTESLEEIIKKEGVESFSFVFTASAQFAHLGASHIANLIGQDYLEKEYVEIFLDKGKFYKFFESYNLPIPKTYYVKNQNELNDILESYPDNQDFFCKSDRSKNPNYIYHGLSNDLKNLDINWKKDIFLKELYVLQETYKGKSLRINIFEDDFNIYDFDSSKNADRHFYDLEKKHRIVEKLKKIPSDLGILNWLLKFDVVVNDDSYVVLDIGLDPPARMKNDWDISNKSFIKFYLDLYIKNKITC